MSELVIPLKCYMQLVCESQLQFPDRNSGLYKQGSVTLEFMIRTDGKDFF